MEQKKFNVSGMTCMHCVGSVKSALGAVKGISMVEVSDDKKVVTVDFEQPANEQIIKDTIESVGFDVE